jgi:ADP-dependent NAD(P)H-hydrate dehydratase / NAD(P)H-hydrate epimerase
MEPVLTPAAMREADRRAIAAGVDEAILIERAGRAVAWHARAMLGGTYGRRIVVLCGNGNNGNDGRVAARVLAQWGARVTRVDLCDALDDSALRRALDECDLAIDAMFGFGFRGELDGVAAAIDAELYRAPRILAVDMPSGVDGTTGEIRGAGFVGGAVLADETLVLAALKPGLLFEPGRFHAGRVTIADIGIELGNVDVWNWTRADAANAPLERWPQEHKWSSAVLVVGGSTGMFGAPLLSARAAQRCGSGMVVVAAPQGCDPTQLAPEVVVRTIPTMPDGAMSDTAADAVLADLGRFAALVIGPGLGRLRPTQRAVRSIVASASVPTVVDADALHALSPDYSELKVRTTSGLPSAILTPHAGEFRSLSGRDIGTDRIEAARWLARETHAVVLLKGPGTVVAEPGGFVAVVANGGSELATAGSGDALCGIIAATCAQLGPLPSSETIAMTVASAAWIHGDAAQRSMLGPSMTASDLIASLPATMQSLRSPTASAHAPGGSAR